MYKPKRIVLYFVLLFLIGVCAVIFYLYFTMNDQTEQEGNANFIEVIE